MMPYAVILGYGLFCYAIGFVYGRYIARRL